VGGARRGPQPGWIRHPRVGNLDGVGSPRVGGLRCGGGRDGGDLAGQTGGGPGCHPFGPPPGGPPPQGGRKRGGGTYGVVRGGPPCRRTGSRAKQNPVGWDDGGVDGGRFHPQGRGASRQLSGPGGTHTVVWWGRGRSRKKTPGGVPDHSQGSKITPNARVGRAQMGLAGERVLCPASKAKTPYSTPPLAGRVPKVKPTLFPGPPTERGGVHFRRSIATGGLTGAGRKGGRGGGGGERDPGNKRSAGWISRIWGAKGRHFLNMGGPPGQPGGAGGGGPSLQGQGGAGGGGGPVFCEPRFDCRLSTARGGLRGTTAWGMPRTEGGGGTGGEQQLGPEGIHGTRPTGEGGPRGDRGGRGGEPGERSG